MKKIALVVLLAFALGGCQEINIRKTNDADCLANWRHIFPDAHDMLGAGAIASDLMNKKQLPNTVGEYLQQCLEEGYRPPGL
jgi:hypothetical protein